MVIVKQKHISFDEAFHAREMGKLVAYTAAQSPVNIFDVLIASVVLCLPLSRRVEPVKLSKNGFSGIGVLLWVHDSCH